MTPSGRTPDDRVWVGLHHELPDVGAVVAFLRAADAGGIDLFVGTTRQFTDGRETVALVYEAFEPLALREMERLAGEVLQRWPALRVALLHRLGRVPVAEASVVVGVSAPHRADAFDACRFLIDALKVSVPIWKQEVYPDGTTAWLEGSVSPDAELPAQDHSGATGATAG